MTRRRLQAVYEAPLPALAEAADSFGAMLDAIASRAPVQVRIGTVALVFDGGRYVCAPSAAAPAPPVDAVTVEYEIHALRLLPRLWALQNGCDPHQLRALLEGWGAPLRIVVSPAVRAGIEAARAAALAGRYLDGKRASARERDRLAESWSGPRIDAAIGAARAGALLPLLESWRAPLPDADRRARTRAAYELLRVVAACVCLYAWKAAENEPDPVRRIALRQQAAAAGEAVAMAHVWRVGQSKSSARPAAALAAKVADLYRRRVIEGGEPARGFAARAIRDRQLRATPQAINRILRRQLLGR